MPILIAKCDICGKEIKNEEIYIDERELCCEKCFIKKEIYNLEQERNELHKWLKQTYLKKVKEIGIQIKILKEKIR